MFGELNIFPVGGYQGAFYGSGDVDDNGYGENMIQPEPGVDITGVSWLLNPFSLAVLLLGVIAGGVGGLTLKLTTPQVVGVVFFGLIFWGTWGAVNTIMESLNIPDILVIIFLVMHWWIFIAAIIQMSTGTSFDNMA